MTRTRLILVLASVILLAQSSCNLPTTAVPVPQLSRPTFTPTPPETPTPTEILTPTPTYTHTPTESPTPMPCRTMPAIVDYGCFYWRKFFTTIDTFCPEAQTEYFYTVRYYPINERGSSAFLDCARMEEIPGRLYCTTSWDSWDHIYASNMPGKIQIGVTDPQGQTYNFPNQLNANFDYDSCVRTLPPAPSQLPELVDYHCIFADWGIEKVALTINTFAPDLFKDIPLNLRHFMVTVSVIEASGTLHELWASNFEDVPGEPGCVSATARWEYWFLDPVNLYIELKSPDQVYYTSNTIPNILIGSCMVYPQIRGYGCHDQNWAFVTIELHPAALSDTIPAEDLTSVLTTKFFIEFKRNGNYVYKEFNSCVPVVEVPGRVYCTVENISEEYDPEIFGRTWLEVGLNLSYLDHIYWSDPEEVFFGDCSAPTPTPTSTPATAPPSPPPCSQYDSPGMCWASGCKWDDPTWSCIEP